MSISKVLRMGVLLAIVVTASIAQPSPFRQPIRPESRPTLRVDANLVLVPVTVTDSRGAIIADLTRDDFILAEEKQQQEIISFAHETAPVSLGLVVDLSGSMASKIAKVRLAVKALLDNVEPEDEEFLVTFADRPELRCSFSSNPSAILDELSSLAPRGSTALFDAVVVAVREMRNAKNRRRVLFVISDGGDNHSRRTEREVRHLLEEEDVQIHAIGIHDHMASREEARGPWVLEDLAAITGGQHHMIDNAGELPGMAAKMGLALHDRYLLGYKPEPIGLSGSFRRIDVKLLPQKTKSRLYVYARRGYRLP